MSAAPVRVAMWSGPRNISTAMMRAWENRGDCAVSDEPLYAHYLDHTGLDHPARDEVIADGDTDWRRVVDALLGPAPGGAAVWYQKHMTHHLLPHMDHDWIAGLRNVLLIRDPRQVVASYVKSRATVTAADIGLPQQVALYDELAARGAAPPVIDAGDFLRAPEAHLRALCDWLGIAFTPRMLSWPKGPRASDGIWAPHWYAQVWDSTGFATPLERDDELAGVAAQVAGECRGHYERLHALRLHVDAAPR
ncbi:sulfotransferase [Pseudoxanthomonas daejeonensis]|uniref:sulfotransferase n=1 Tax=Pseudoxanthomonas daejeonensis TaxID=266062 RepID=UPI001F541934|nr:sulfotransferase [Pseudoxanthomonas daejeonensis]UNK57875.1 sulfotransferase [Pseudoxanthomonas daejeonensis]